MFYLKAIAAAVVALAVWGAFVVFSTLNGWWHSPITSDSNPSSFVEAAKRVISEQNVGNVALVLIEGGAVYAEHFDAASQKIDRETIFPTASMSKWIPACVRVAFPRRNVSCMVSRLTTPHTTSTPTNA